MTQSIYSRLWTLSGVINVNIRRGKAINASQPFSVLSIPTLDLYAGTLSFDDTVKPFPVMSTPLAKCADCAQYSSLLLLATHEPTTHLVQTEFQ